MKLMNKAAIAIILASGLFASSQHAQAWWWPWSGGGPWGWGGNPWYGGYPGWGGYYPYGYGAYPGWGGYYPYSYGVYPGWGGYYPYSYTAPAATTTAPASKAD